MNLRLPVTLDELEQWCTRCNHQNGVHTGTERPRWGWPIYDDVWMRASGWCSHPGCTCKARTSDPAAAPAPPRTFTPPAPRMPQPCASFVTGRTTLCGAEPARLYVNGWRCAAHTPAALKGQQEPREGACAPLRHLCLENARCATWAWQQQPWRVLATGGRDRTDKPRIWTEFDKILAVHPRLTVVHGGAYPRPERGTRPDRSADWLIHLWCKRNPDVTEEIHPADWKTHGRGAGLIRNTEMAKLGADECVAFPGNGNGTRHCMAQASAAGIPVRPIWPHAPSTPTATA
ncbi:SLOG family protein [Nonomuraea sp. MTCD27]|uniref:SLOG family protein n=1 Tax=Nonomuraea sp. MTCD27 TaxID=1676747 RepID=UPI0035C048FE